MPEYIEREQEMTLERAAEILDPEHREHYDSIETVNKACEIGRNAILKQIPKKVNISLKGTTGWNTKCHCPNCRSFISRGKYCSECGQALDWRD